MPKLRVFKIGHIDATGKIAEYAIPTADAGADGLAAGTGPDGTTGGAWFSETSVGQLGYIDSSGQISEFTLPDARPGQIAFANALGAPPLTGYANSQAVWWTDAGASQVGLARFPVGTPTSCLCGGPVPIILVPSTLRLALGRRIMVRGAAVKLVVRCVGAFACAGRVQLLGPRPRAGKPYPLLASASFTIGPSRSKTLRLSLNRAAQRMLRAHQHGLTTRVTVHASTGRAPPTQVVTLLRT